MSTLRRYIDMNPLDKVGMAVDLQQINQYVV